MNQQTLVLIKPDAVQRLLIGNIISRFESKGFKIVAMKMVHIPRQTAEQHYQEHRQKEFFEDLVCFLSGGPSVALVIEGDEAVKTVRAMVGATHGLDAHPGTIRGDFGGDKRYNLVHASDGEASASAEIAIFFPEGCLHYERNIDRWMISP